MEGYSGSNPHECSALPLRNVLVIEVSTMLVQPPGGRTSHHQQLGKCHGVRTEYKLRTEASHELR